MRFYSDTLLNSSAVTIKQTFLNYMLSHFSLPVRDLFLSLSPFFSLITLSRPHINQTTVDIFLPRPPLFLLVLFFSSKRFSHQDDGILSQGKNLNKSHFSPDISFRMRDLSCDGCEEMFTWAMNLKYTRLAKILHVYYAYKCTIKLFK
jgi:hypothetical protein